MTRLDPGRERLKPGRGWGVEQISTKAGRGFQGADGPPVAACRAARPGPWLQLQTLQGVLGACPPACTLGRPRL